VYNIIDKVISIDKIIDRKFIYKDKKMIKAIFFDAAGILYTRGGHTEAYALNLLQKNGFSTEVQPNQYSHQMDLRSQANEGTVSHDVYWDEFLMMRGVADPQTRKAYATEIIDYSNAVLPVPGAHEALSKLKQKGILLGIITDTMYPLEWKMRRLEKAGVAEFIEIVACSTEIGAHKPDPAVYAYALEQAKLTCGQTAFVGHLGVELEGAKKAGMTTIAVDHDEDAVADYYCHCLNDINDLPILMA
jgi:HAD superfamily hydrolase (TIGR01509 family)